MIRVMPQNVQVGSVTASFCNVRLPIGLVLDRIEIEGQDAELHTDPLHLELPEPGNVRVFVGAESLEKYLNEQAPGGLRDFQVRLVPGAIEVQATARVIVELRATATCKLRIEHGRELHVELMSVDVLGGSAKSLVESQLDKINPILDAREYPVQLELHSVEITSEAVIVTGTLAP